MRNLVTFNSLTHPVHGKVLFSNISGSIKEKNIICLIGDNGSGKSTLLRDLSREGTRVRHFAKVGVLPQEFQFGEQSVSEFLVDISENWWDIEFHLKNIFDEEIELEKQMNKLSGGELVKLHLCILLADKVDIFFLDEPTNHLDLQSRAKLINFIKESRKTFLIATHDIDFMNSVALEIWDLNKDGLFKYKGDYDSYIEYKNAVSKNKEVLYELKVEKLNKLNKIVETKAKESKATHDKVHRDPYLKKKAGKKGHQAQVLKSKIEKHIEKEIADLEQVKTRKPFLSLDYEAKRGPILSLDGYDLKIGEKILVKDINLILSHGEKIAITGANKTGKTTLLKVLQSEIKPTVKAALLDQNYSLLDSNLTVWENFQRFNPTLSLTDSRRYLGNFLFDTEDKLKVEAKFLSGGEKARLCFACITTGIIDLLILDEPTNNIDISTQETITEGLRNFKGAVVVVSHSQQFINEIGTTKILKIENSKLIAI